MQLQLTVQQAESASRSREKIHRFERFPIVIGRSTSCDLVLRDESRYVSSNHAVISLVEGMPRIRDTSANGVFLNESNVALGRGIEAPLHDGDIVGVGDFTLLVALVDDRSTSSQEDPFDALLDDTLASNKSSQRDMDDAGQDDVDEGPWIDDKPETPILDVAAPPITDAPVSVASTQVDDDDAWAIWASEPSIPESRATPRTMSPPSEDEQVTTAEPETPEQRREAMLLQCIEGLMALLRSRLELKQAMRTDVTSLSGVGNNPLKFSRDGKEALKRLLDPPSRGEYLAPDEALAQAIDDLSLHQVAMLEGMKGAVDALLTRFDPDNLTERLTTDHPIAATIPVTRDAKLWQLFREHYDSIEQSARGDFSAMFGREFRKAYEARIRELGREPEPW